MFLSNMFNINRAKFLIGSARVPRVIWALKVNAYQTHGGETLFMGIVCGPHMCGSG